MTGSTRHGDIPALPLPSHALAIEAWLEGLRGREPHAGEAPGPSGGPRTLIILDNDFGELTTIMYLVLGQPCFRNARILANKRLFATNQDALPGRVTLWSGEADAVEAVDSFRPHVIILASGYLLRVHRLLGADGIARLCEQAKRIGAVVVTADPFLGLVSHGAGEDLGPLVSIAIPDRANESLVAAKKMGDAMLHTGLVEAEKALRSVPHLYPAYADMEGLEPWPGDARNLSFFNDALVLPPDLAPAGPGDDPYWMFLISLVDYQTQCMFEGALEFVRIVADKLLETVALGRRAILLGPSDLIEYIAVMLPADERIRLLAFCPFTRAMSLLLAAEACFYWNQVSHSVIMPLWNARPVFFFDRGHLVRAAPALYPRILAWYHQGVEPSWLDQKAALSLPVVEREAAAKAAMRADIVARYRRAPSPAVMLGSLLGGHEP
jgi:hypothetical protein